MHWIIAILLGIVFLYLGSEWLVDGAKRLAVRLGIAPFVIGLTVLAFGSSAPECVTSIVSRGTPSIIIGNVIGSNIANVGLAIGLAALINPITAKFTSMIFEVLAMLFSSALITVFAAFGAITMWEGILLIAMLLAFIFIVYRLKVNDKEGQEAYTSDVGEDEKEGFFNSLIWFVIKIAVGLVVLYYGAEFFVNGATDLARIIGVSELFIGLIVVAIGTSLPELCICLMAAYRKENDLAVSNIVGSNIFNALFVLGIGASLVDIPITQQTLTFHMPVMIGLSALMALMIWKKDCISRRSAAVLFIIYAAYIATMALVPSLTM